MSEPTTCSRCGMTDTQGKRGGRHYDWVCCLEALGVAVRELQARGEPTEQWMVYELQPEGGGADGPGVSDVASGASAGSDVGAPEPIINGNKDAPPPQTFREPRVDTVTTGKLEGKIPIRAPERDETMAEIERLVDEFGADAECGSMTSGAALDARAALMAAIRAAVAKPAEPDPTTMEAWADWYMEHPTASFLWAGNWLRAVAQRHRSRARAHREATGDTP